MYIDLLFSLMHHQQMSIIILIQSVHLILRNHTLMVNLMAKIRQLLFVDSFASYNTQLQITNHHLHNKQIHNQVDQYSNLIKFNKQHHLVLI